MYTPFDCRPAPNANCHGMNGAAWPHVTTKHEDVTWTAEQGISRLSWPSSRHSKAVAWHCVLLSQWVNHLLLTACSGTSRNGRRSNLLLATYAIKHVGNNHNSLNLVYIRKRIQSRLCRPPLLSMIPLGEVCLACGPFASP